MDVCAVKHYFQLLLSTTITNADLNLITITIAIISIECIYRSILITMVLQSTI